jgi:hypothetical protein
VGHYLGLGSTTATYSFKYLAAFRHFVKAECCVFGECIKVEIHGEDCE